MTGLLFDFNRTLSAHRAQTVADWLLAHRVPPGQLTAKGYGERHPIADNGSEQGRAKNRRVELVCSGK